MKIPNLIALKFLIENCNLQLTTQGGRHTSRDCRKLRTSLRCYIKKHEPPAKHKFQSSSMKQINCQGGIVNVPLSTCSFYPRLLSRPTWGTCEIAPNLHPEWKWKKLKEKNDKIPSHFQSVQDLPSKLKTKWSSA